MAVPRRIVLYQSNDQVVELFGLQDSLTGDYLNSATVTATLKRKGIAIEGCDEISLNYILSSNGNYRGQVEETFNPPAKSGYVLHYDADQGGTVLHIEIPTVVKIRRS